MFISVVQFEPKFGDIEANYSKVSHAINSDNSDIIVFPELVGKFVMEYDLLQPHVFIEKVEEITKKSN